MPFIHAHQDFFVASVNYAFLSHFFPNKFCFGMGQLGKLYLFRTLLLVSLHFVDEHLPVVKEFLTATVFLINFFGGFQYFSGTAIIPWNTTAGISLWKQSLNKRI